MSKRKIFWCLEIGTWKFPNGFTLPELIIVMVVFATLVGLVTINLVRAKQGTSLNTTVSILISDLKQQQLKAMIGDSEGRGTASNYGIHIDPEEYILFYGSSYNVLNTANAPIEFGDNIVATASADIVFTKVSGETTATNIVLEDNVTHNQKTLHINRYGVVTLVN